MELQCAKKRFSTGINCFINAAEETENWKLLIWETYLYNPLAAHDIQAYRDMEKDELELRAKRWKINNWL